jgi:two-component system cell cycle sensor histidine kinase/response regulator CckA
MMPAAAVQVPSRVLVVEDEALIAEEIHDRLTRLAFDVVGVEDTGEGAVRMADRTRPDLVLMDIRLKGHMDGIAAAAEIRRDLDIPVVFLTAHSDQATLQRAKAAAPFGYVLKPFQERDLVVTIDMAVHQHQLEQRLRQSEIRFSTTLASIGDGVAAVDEQGLVTFMNPMAEALTGWTAADASGRTITEIAEVVDEHTGRPIDHPLVVALRDGRIVRFDAPVMLMAPTGPELIEGCAAPMFNHRGRLSGAVLAFRDVRARRRAEEAARFAEAELRQAQKVEAIGHLAGGVAHDFNNLLTVINGYAESMSERELDATSTEYVRLIRSAGTRATLLTRQLLAFGRKQVFAPRLLDVNAELAALEVFLRRLIGDDIVLACEFGADVGLVHADPTQFEQVILNLAINARDAMPAGGRLMMTTAAVHLDGPDLLPGEYLRVTVSDTGCGMNAATRLRIFEPFFTTKPLGQGTGLGLSTVSGIVRQSGGHIDVVSEVGIGTTFTFYLPTIRVARPADVAVVADVPVMPGHETVLVVEDQAEVREFVAHTLRRYGYTTLEANGAAEAIAICGSHPGHIELLVSDVVMPGVGGPELATRIATLRPGIRVLFMSGYAEESLTRKGTPIVAVSFLEKPFSSQALARRVREVLDVDNRHA